jgi:hypothetical protein
MYLRDWVDLIDQVIEELGLQHLHSEPRLDRSESWQQVDNEYAEFRRLQKAARERERWRHQVDGIRARFGPDEHA